jgi:SAM-dependent methyltransferase
MIAHARKKAAERRPAIRYEAADAEQLPFADASFDIAVSRYLLWTLPHPDGAMDEWMHVLRPGGRLIVVDSRADVAT